MNKLAAVLVVCLIVLFAAAIFAEPSIQMEFVGEFRAGRPAIVRVSTTDIDLTNTIRINSAIQDGDDVGKTSWANYIDSSLGVVANGMNPDTLLENNFLVADNSIVVCVDETTHRPLASLGFSGFGTMSIIAIEQTHGENFPSGAYGSFTFLCPMSFVTYRTDQASAPEFTLLTAIQSGPGPANSININFTLAAPAVWSWRQPLITINSASYSANTGNLLGGKVKFQFSTDTAGIHHINIRNGPQPIFYNRVNQEFTSYQCGDNVEAYIIAAEQEERWLMGPSSSTNELQIHVKDSAANGAPITCIVDVDGYMSSAFTERSQVVVEMDTVLVAQGIDFPVLDATFTADFGHEGGVYDNQALFIVKAFDLPFSASPLHTNSTVEIRFTGIDVNTIKPTSTEYRQDEVCPGLGGTFSQDGKSVFIKDISKIDNGSNFPNLFIKNISQDNNDSFLCVFNFVGSKIVRLDELSPVPTVQVLVDGVSLYNRAARSTSFPLYLPVNTRITNTNSKIYQDDSTIKHVVEFALSDGSASVGTVPQKPVLVLSYAYSATWPIASYGDVLSCEATSPSSSAYTPLVMTFDLDRRTWTADLSTLIDTDAYQVKFRCTRSEAVVKKFDIVQNFSNRLTISFLDVVSQKGYNRLEEDWINEQPTKNFLKYPTNPDVPIQFTQYFSFPSSIFISDFATLASVSADVSTKVLAAIKAGYDAYDTQLPPPTLLTKLSPKLVNKAKLQLNEQSGITTSSRDYSATFGQIVYNLYYTIIGHQFQQSNVESSTYAYGDTFYNTAHLQMSTPKVKHIQYFTSGSTYEEIQAILSAQSFDFNSQIRSKFYKDAFSTSPAIPFTFTTDGFDFPFDFSPISVMSPISACGYYEVAYEAADDNTTYKFNYDNMLQMGPVRFTCNYAETCSSDADCVSGYCSQDNTCAVTKPTLKYPYVKYNTVADFSEYDGYNNSVVASLTAAVVAIIVAIVM